MLWVLVSFSDWDTGKNARPGLDVLAQVVGSKPRSVQRSIHRLTDRGLIERTGGGFRGRVTSYRIDLDHIENGAGKGDTRGSEG
ncbi:MAG: helix-turn-helix domain-containing protein [Actinomycetia bacterium]|nr:helix-turn-helix domain-containing protein [Actinomycetes bacterium]